MCYLFFCALKASTWEVRGLKVCPGSAEEDKNNLITVPPYLNLK